MNKVILDYLKSFIIKSTGIFMLMILSINAQTNFPFLDTKLSTDERVDDLVGRMTLKEKIGQMMNAAPAIDRLEYSGI